jgi:hypothetical protein
MGEVVVESLCGLLGKQYTAELCVQKYQATLQQTGRHKQATLLRASCYKPPP